MKLFAITLFLISAILIPTSCPALDVLVNQVGYEPNAPKIFRAQRATDYAGDGTFAVRKVSDNSDVFTGTLVRRGGLWNKFYWEGDFSSLKTTDNYYVYANVNGETANSYNFTIAPDILLTKTGKLTYQFFTAQRCGAAVSLQYVNRSGNTVTWSHNACHLDDGYINPSGPQMDATGGWHDAGDYGKYGQGFAGNPVFDLIWLYESNTSFFDAQDVNANGIADIIDEALWQARWLVKIVQANGHVMSTMGQRRSGASWVKPENDTNNEIGTSDDRWVYPGTEDTPQETVVCASLAKMHRLLASKGLPTENFAAKALAIWDHRVALAESQGGHNNLGSGSQQIWAGLDLYAIYGQQNCWDRATQRIDELIWTINNNPTAYDDGYEAPGYELGVLAWFVRNYPTHALAASGRTAVQTLMSRNINYLVGGPLGLIRRDEGGGSLQYLPTNASLGNNRLLGFIAWGAIESYKTIGDPAYLRFALDQYNWILGANYHRVCMMEAAGDYHLNKYHSRYDTFVTNGIEPGIVTNGYIRDANGIPWVDFGTGSVSVQTNESWLPNSSAYAMALAGMAVFRDGIRWTINPNRFDYGSDGWTISTWKAGSYSNGTMVWNGSAGNGGGGMRCNGSWTQDNVDRCSREGGEIYKVIPTTGYTDIKVSYDLKVNSLGTSYTGAGTGSCNVDHNLVDEQVTAYYSIDGGTNWIEKETISRADLLASYQSYGTRQLDFTGMDLVNNNPSFAVRFRWQLNTASDTADIDNVIVSGLGASELVAPSGVTGFSATPGSLQVSLSWTNPSDADFTGTKILFKTTGYPTSATDGTVVCDKLNRPGTTDSYTHTGLTMGNIYYYAAFAYDELTNYSGAATASANLLSDTTPPGNVTGFAASSQAMQINLSWANPTDSDFAGTKVLFKTTGYPSNSTDGTLLHSGTGTSSAHTGLSTGTVYYYAAFSYDSSANYSSGATASVARTGPYCFCDSFPYANGNLNGNLNWSGTATDQIVVENGLLKMIGGATAYDAVRTVSCGDPGSGYIWAAFKAKAGVGASTMWSLYIDDPAGNNLARWYGTATTARGRIGGTSDVTSVWNLTSNWAELSVKISPSADTSEFFVNGVSIGVLNHASQGAGDTVGRLRWERPDYAPAAGNYVYFDDLEIGPPDTIAAAPVSSFTATPTEQQVDLSWINPLATDLAGVKVLFKTTGYPANWTDGAVIYDGLGTGYTHSGLTDGTTYYYSAFTYDEIPNVSSAVNATAVPGDYTPPLPVVSFQAQGLPGRINLTWYTPCDLTYSGAMIRFKTSGYPTGPTDGVECYRGPGTTYLHKGLANGTYYYSAFAYDEALNYSTKSDAWGVAHAEDATIAQVKRESGGVRYLRTKTVTATFADCFYMQEPVVAGMTDTHLGIRVLSSVTVSPGESVTVLGAIGGAHAERYVDAREYIVDRITPGPGVPMPVSLSGVAVGGALLNGFTPGVKDGLGPNNIGSYVRVWGKITQKQTTPVAYFYISDGSTGLGGAPLTDGTQTSGVDNVGIRIDMSPGTYQADDYVVVTGIVSVFDDGLGHLIRKVIPVSVQKLAP